MNVFDITQGVAIGIFVRALGNDKVGGVRHADLWGVRGTEHRAGKYPWLSENILSSTHWLEVEPESPQYVFKPRTNVLGAEYQRGWSVSDVLLCNNMGVTTGVDSFAVAFSARELKKRVSDLAAEREGRLHDEYGLRNTSSFSISDARRWARSPEALSSIVPIAYRCFDERFVIYSSSVLARSRADICHHLIAHNNQALITFRSIRRLPWAHAFVSARIATKEYLSTLDNSYIFPLYVYPKKRRRTDQAELSVEFSAWPPGQDRRRPNLNPEFVADLEKQCGLSFMSDGKGDLQRTFGPEDVLSYIYAVFASPAYRMRHAESLKSDFPRVPLTSVPELFRLLCAKGADLLALHLLEDDYPRAPWNISKAKGKSLLSGPITKFSGRGDAEIAKGYPQYVSGKVYINPLRWFDGVPETVWSFQVGAYQVCEKWLKDRRGRVLSEEDIAHYQKIVVALKETIRLMSEIDNAIDAHGGWPGAFVTQE